MRFNTIRIITSSLVLSTLVGCGADLKPNWTAETPIVSSSPNTQQIFQNGDHLLKVFQQDENTLTAQQYLFSGEATDKAPINFPNGEVIRVPNSNSLYVYRKNDYSGLHVDTETETVSDPVTLLSADILEQYVVSGTPHASSNGNLYIIWSLRDKNTNAEEIKISRLSPDGEAITSENYSATAGNQLSQDDFTFDQSGNGNFAFSYIEKPENDRPTSHFVIMDSSLQEISRFSQSRSSNIYTFFNSTLILDKQGSGHSKVNLQGEETGEVAQFKRAYWRADNAGFYYFGNTQNSPPFLFDGANWPTVSVCYSTADFVEAWCNEAPKPRLTRTDPHKMFVTPEGNVVAVLRHRRYLSANLPIHPDTMVNRFPIGPLAPVHQEWMRYRIYSVTGSTLATASSAMAKTKLLPEANSAPSPLTAEGATDVYFATFTGNKQLVSLEGIDVSEPIEWNVFDWLPNYQRQYNRPMSYQ